MSLSGLISFFVKNGDTIKDIYDISDNADKAVGVLKDIATKNHEFERNMAELGGELAFGSDIRGPSPIVFWDDDARMELLGMRLLSEQTLPMKDAG